MDEAQLQAMFLQGLAGDARAYASFLEQLASHLRAFFRRRLFVGPDQAEDLAQDVLIAIHAKRTTYDPQQPLAAWVYAIARYKLTDHLRRARQRLAHLPIDAAGELFLDAEPESGVASRDVVRLLEQLPPKQRAAIHLVKIEELSVREAAQRASMSESDVKVSIHRGLKALARLIKG